MFQFNVLQLMLAFYSLYAKVTEILIIYIVHKIDTQTGYTAQQISLIHIGD